MLPLEDLLRLMDEVPVMLACYDAVTQRCLYANRAYAALGGFTPTEAIGRTADEIVGVEVNARIRPDLERALAEGRPLTYARSASVNGAERWIEVTLVPSGVPASLMFIVATDMTAHRAAEMASRQNADRLAKFMAASVEGIAFHKDGVVTDINPPLLRLLGYESPHEMIGRLTTDFVEPTELARVRRVLAAAPETSYESLAVQRDGTAIPVEYTVRNMEWAGRQQRMIIVRDLRETHAARSRIRFLAAHDALTSLPNRARLDEHLNEMIALSGEQQQPFAVLFLDLDQLKRVNDSLGHASGDEVLIALAGKLRAFCDECNQHGTHAWLARHGGDEFVMTCRTGTRLELIGLIERLRHIFDTPTRVGTRQFRVTASIGVALFPDDGDTPTQLLKNADAAMYLAKSAGRDTVRFFDQAIAREADRALMIEEALGPALVNGEFELHYQPAVSADGMRLLSVEALIRWNRGDGGLWMPDEFIPIAESMHQFVPIGGWVIDTALDQVAHWRALGWLEPLVAVNLSSNQFRAPDFVDSLLAALTRRNLPGTCLQLEVTERMLMHEDAALQDALTRLRTAGVSLAIDDFGTGFSSLSRLRTLAVDTLKIDQSFVRELPASASSSAIVNTIVDLAHGLSMTTIAEGVETLEQQRCLQGLGCRVMQGFLFAKPMPAAQFDRWLQQLLARG